MIAVMRPDVTPIFGSTQYTLAFPYAGLASAENLNMPIRKVLSDNFRRLREINPRLRDFKDITQISNVSNGTLGRIHACTTATKIDTLADLAGAYGLEAWQLLVPEMNPVDPPAIKGAKPSAHKSRTEKAHELAVMYDGIIDPAAARKKFAQCTLVLSGDYEIVAAVARVDVPKAPEAVDAPKPRPHKSR